jgi:hypothetical protein
VQRVVVAAVVAIEVPARAEAMLRQAMQRRVILLLRQMVPLPQAVEAPEAEQAEEVAEAAVDVAGVARLPKLLFLKPPKLH